MKRRLPPLISLFAITSLLLAVGCGDDDVATPEDEEGRIIGTVALQEADDHAGVLVTAGEASTTTDSSGAFELARIEPGEVEVRAEMEGYLDESQTAEVEAGDETVVDFELSPEPTAPVIEEVTLDPEVLFPLETADVTVTAHDPDGTDLNYSYDVDEGFEIDGDGAQAVLTAPDSFDASGELTVSVEDASGLVSEYSIDVATESNEAPVIESMSAVPGEFDPGESGNLEVQAYDPQGSELSFAWSSPEGWELGSTDDSSVEITAPANPADAATIEVVVTDAGGAEAVGQLEVSTRPAQPPQIDELSAEPPQTSPGGQISLSVEATDPDGGELYFEWSAPSDWTIIDGQQPETTIVAPDEYGSVAHIELEVTNEFGASKSAQLLVSTVENLGPQISSISADPTEVTRGGTISLNVEASHPEEDELDYHWEAPSGWDLVEDSDAPESPELIAPDTPGVTDTVEVAVSDSTGAEAMVSVLVRTQTNLAPVIESLTTDPPSVVPGDTIVIEASAYDPDDSGLTYEWDVPADWDGASSSDVLELTAPETYATSATVTVTVDDGTDTTTASITVSTLPNIDPVIASFTATPAAVERGQESTLQVDAYHQYGEILDYEWSLVDDDDDDWTLDANEDTATLTAPDDAGQSVTVAVDVADDHGGSAQATLTVTTLDNNAPTIHSFTADPAVVSRGGESSLSVDATDPDGGSLEYTWTVDDDPDDDWTLDANEDTATLTAPDASGQSVTITVEVEDNHGYTAQASVAVETEDNQAPYISSFSADPQILSPGAESTLSVDATDPNGVTLSYDWSFADAGDEDDWTLSGAGDTATLSAPNANSASTTIVITVSDGHGGEATSEITVTTD